jgi:hypothetical protein
MIPANELVDRIARLLASEPVLNNNSHIWACAKMGFPPSYQPGNNEPADLAYHAHCAAYRATVISRALGLLVNLEARL